MTREDSAAFDVFFSYSHKDEKLRDGLAEHLQFLEHDGKIRAWHDRKILAGDEWADRLDERLESSDLILLLVSSSFMAFKFCREVELRRALERHAAGAAKVVPIILRPCYWQSAPFGKLQVLPKDALAITSWRDPHEAFLDVARGLLRVIDDMAAEREKRSAAVPTTAPSIATEDLSRALKNACREKALLERRGQDTALKAEEIIHLKRQLREGARLRKGDVLADRFELLELLGHGGFAQVWKASDTKREEAVAVKVLHPQYAADKTLCERFFRGAQVMSMLRHTGIVGVSEKQLEDGGFYFFVMDYLGGGDLRQTVLAGRLSTEERLQVVLAVGEALQYTHAQGVVHRDVKPANILLGLDGRPRLTDFDLVKAAGTTGGTRTSSSLGTFLYAAPEAMLDASQATAAADVYGLGMTTLFALHGADLPTDVLWELPEFLAALEVDEACREVLTRAVARKVEQRFATVGELCDALRRVLEPKPPKPKPHLQNADVIESASECPAKHSPRERVNEKDGSVLVYVPGGEFTLGSGDLGSKFSDEARQWPQPVHRVVLSPYWIGKVPVTNAQYERFLKANPAQRKAARWNDERFNASQQPVVGVSWQDALAYCRWAGLDLPNEAQWEAAARGTDQRRYPWGDDEPTPQLAKFGDDWKKGRPVVVGSYPQSSGPYGTLDQAGNVWEWCRDVFDKKAYRDRGGQLDPWIRGCRHL